MNATQRGSWSKEVRSRRRGRQENSKSSLYLDDHLIIIPRPLSHFPQTVSFERLGFPDPKGIAKLNSQPFSITSVAGKRKTTRKSVWSRRQRARAVLRRNGRFDSLDYSARFITINRTRSLTTGLVGFIKNPAPWPQSVVTRCL